MNTEAVLSLNDVRVAAIDASNLTFVWNDNIEESNDFSDAIVYNINASNCGVCPNRTTTRSATCIHFVANGRICSITLQAVACGNILGPTTDPLLIVIPGSYNKIIVISVLSYHIAIYYRLSYCLFSVLEAPVVDAKHVLLPPGLSLINTVFNESVNA